MKLTQRFASTVPVKIRVEESGVPTKYSTVDIVVEGRSPDDMAWVLDRMGEQMKRMAKQLRDHS